MISGAALSQCPMNRSFQEYFRMGSLAGMSVDRPRVIFLPQECLYSTEYFRILIRNAQYMDIFPDCILRLLNIKTVCGYFNKLWFCIISSPCNL